MTTEAYNLGANSSLSYSAWLRPISPQQFEQGTFDFPGISNLEAVYSVQSRKMGSNFTLYKGDGTKGGVSLMHVKRANWFTTKIYFKLEHTGEEIVFKRPKDSNWTAKTRGFEYNNVVYRFESPYIKNPHAKLYNTQTGELIAEYKHKRYSSKSIGNMIMYNCDKLDPIVKSLIVGTVYEMSIEEREFEATMTTGA